jgi:type VI secretion system protein ImpH
MASKSRPTSDTIAAEKAALEKALQEQPYKFGFYQALRRFECLNRDKPRLGASLRPVDDALRLTQNPSLAFAAATLASFKPAEEGKPSQLAVNFFGMFGPNGPLPLHLTEYARDRLRNSDDPAFSEFLDIFHHRMLSLFYRSWASAQPTVNFDRPEQDRFSVYTGALFGLGMPSLRNRDEIPDLVKLHFAGRLSSQTRNAEGLAAMISSFFKVPAVIEQFVGEWMELPDDCRCRLGVSPQTGTLGVNVAIGNYVWQCQQKFRIILGPLDMTDYQRLLPRQESEKRLRSMVRNYVGDSMNWDVNLVLKNEKVPRLKLGQDDQLGWNTWLGTLASEDDVHDLVWEPMKTGV